MVIVRLKRRNEFMDLLTQTNLNVMIYPFHPFITRFIRGWKMDWIRVDGWTGDGWIGWIRWMRVMDAGGCSPAKNPTRCQPYSCKTAKIFLSPVIVGLSLTFFSVVSTYKWHIEKWRKKYVLACFVLWNSQVSRRFDLERLIFNFL